MGSQHNLWDLALRKPQSISQGLDSGCGGWTDLEEEHSTEEGGRLVSREGTQGGGRGFTAEKVKQI